MTFSTTYITRILVPDPVESGNPITKGYLDATVGESLQDQLATILNAVDVILVGDVRSVTTATTTATITEGNYTRIFVDNFGVIKSGTNLLFTSGDVQGTVTGATVDLNLSTIASPPGIYGGGTSFPQITIDSKGRITSATNVAPLLLSNFQVSGNDGQSNIGLDSNSYLQVLGTANQLSVSVTDNTISLALTDPAVIPGILQAGAITANTVTSITGFVGTLIGNVIGNVTGNFSGNLTATSVVATIGSFTNITSTGLATVGRLSEIVSTKTGASGSVAHDYSVASVWYHSAVTGNFTVSLLNVSTATNRALALTLFISQGPTPYISNGLAINGTTVNINWANNVLPSGNVNKLDMISFTFLRLNDVWTATGSLVTYG